MTERFLAAWDSIDLFAKFALLLLVLGGIGSVFTVWATDSKRPVTQKRRARSEYQQGIGEAAVTKDRK
jgi:hypothetical protein